MTVSSLLFFLVFFFFLVVFLNGQCLDDQKKLLLELKSSSFPLSFMSWNATHDCCEWAGVECDGSGHVIVLKLDRIKDDISGRISDSSTLFNLTYLSELRLWRNDFTTSEIPNQFHRLTNLAYLALLECGFIGPIPSTLANLTKLVLFDLSGNSLTGPVPSLHSSKNLEIVDLSDNNLTGSLSDSHFQGLTKLTHLDLRHNSLEGTIPHHVFALPSLIVLYLSNNQFSGQIEDSPIVNNSSLLFLDLSSNRIEGHVPNFFFQFRSMIVLELSNNLFSGVFELDRIRSLANLSEIILSNNNLSVDTSTASPSSYGYPRIYTFQMSSCNLYDFPDLRNLSLSELDLSNNYIAGDIPSWIWEMELVSLNLSLNLLTDFQKPYHISNSINTIDLHSNRLRCELPLLSEALEFGYAYLFLANNSLSGAIPTSICSRSRMVLDLSFNNLTGSIPQCLVDESSNLNMLKLRGNNINGVIPDQFPTNCGLKTFDVSDNNLGGKIPKSLANCQELAVMNVANNNFDDSFPCMALPASLKVLVLRSNRFHGDLTCHKIWPHLQILDISSNNFSGTLESLNFSSWSGMMLESPAHTRPNRSDSDILSPYYPYRDEVALTVKGFEVKLVKIWPDFTSIDLSSNSFQGEIPDAIANLTSLYLLNLSHNSLTDVIPKSLGALTELGSLDLSANKLIGRIPEELAKLTFLSVLNVSYNHLTGMIPTGPQLQTFSADSFEGNKGLCGLPLNISCSSHQGPGSTPSEPEDEEIEWEYVLVALGYVVGFGSIVWTLLCCRSLRERYFEKIEEVVDKVFYERGRRRRHARRVRRREERKNGVRRHHQ